MAGNSSSEATANVRLIRAAKPEDPCSFAFGLARNAADCFLSVDKSKAPKALEADAKKGSASGAKLFSGTVHFDGSRAVFTTEDAPTGADKALTDWFKHQKVTMVATVAKPQAPEPPQQQGEEEDEGPKLYATETLSRRFQAALRNPFRFAFGPGRTPDETLLALHPRREGGMLFRALRQQNHAIRGSWGTLEMDGRVAVFRCEEKPIPGLRKQIRAFLRDRALRYRVKVFGPEGEVIEPGDEEEDAADLRSEQQAAADPGQRNDAGELATLLQRMQQMLPTLQEIAKVVPTRAEAIRIHYSGFDGAQKGNGLDAARSEFNALLDLGRSGRVEMGQLQEMRKRLDAMLPDLQGAATRQPGLRDRIRDDWRSCDAAIKAGETQRARELLIGLAALVQPQGGAQPGVARGTVAHRQMLLRWRQAQSTVRTNLQTLGRALLANDAVQADPRFAGVQRAVGRLESLIPEFGDKLDDALDAAMNVAEPAQVRELNQAALVVLGQYRTTLRAQTALSKLEEIARLCGAGELRLHGEFESAMDELQQGLAAAA